MFRETQRNGAIEARTNCKHTIVCFMLLLVWMFCTTVHAQVLYGSLTGNVTDQTSAIVPQAKVEAVSVGTGVIRNAETDSNGIYRFPELVPGVYKISFSASNFATVVVENVRVEVNTLRRVDIKLKVAASTQTVEVTAAPALLQTDKADVHTDLTAQQVENLPTMGSQGRNFQSLLRLVPGVGLTAETNSLAGNPQRAINANVNGQSNQTVNTRIDGAQDAYPWLPANVAYVPPADAIETVNVVTNSFDAEQGMAGGAAVNVQIKSGTNQYHGSADWFHTDQNFAARNYFQTNPTIFPKKNRNNQNQFGGTFGGPIKKDKLFFFIDYERTTQRQKAGPDTRTLPTAAMASGDFRNLPGNPIIYDPATGNAQGAGKTQVSCNGVLNVICPNRIDPAAAAMIKLLQPSIAQVFSTANGLSNFVGSSTALFNRDTADVKINYVPDSKTTVFGRYSLSKTLVFDPPLLGAAVGDATGGGQLGDAPGLIQSVGLGATYTFTPSLLLDWNFGFTRQRLGSTFDLTSPKGLNDLHIPGTNNAGAPGNPSLYYGLPGFSFPTGGASFGNAQPANPFLFRDQQFVSGANLSWMKGKHALRGGIEWNHSQLNHFQPQGGTFQEPRGAFQFNGNVTALQGTTPTWFNSWADFLLGLPSTTGKSIALFNPTALRWSQWAWYLRDQWQVTPKLTLTLGVRWERYPFGYSDNGKGLRYLDLNTGNVLIGGYGTVPRDDRVDVGSGQFLPRIGIAYRLTSSTVIRAGYGQSADPNNWRYFRNAYPANIIVNNAVANSANFIPVASLTGLNGAGLGSGSYNVPTGIVLVPLPDLSSGVIPLPTNASTTTIRNPFRRGYINSFNFMVQQEWKGLVLETGYVGARAIRPLVNMNVNASPPGTGSAGGLLSVALGANYTGNINAEVPFKNNYYDSMQTKITRRFKQGSTAGFVWTWSKTTDYQGNEELAALKFPYPTYWGRNRAVADFDRTHNIKIYGLLLPPFGKGQRWAQSGVGNWLLGGWQISPVISRLTGLPFTVTSGGSLNANGSIQTADLVGQFHLTNGRPLPTGQTCAQSDPTCHFFDASAFAAPLITSAATAHYGNTGRNQFRGPGYFEMDLSVSRAFKLTERFTLQLRADAFSLTNTPHFANPNTGCPGSATIAGPAAGSGQLCSTGSNNNFGVITGTLQPGGFFGPDSGARTIWMGARVTF
ncbi:MAG TPA: TonB-dependent receptor [Terriglobales bacterium]|jgi:outer membrane receptor protein involved in Fe transport|nr:TonB-dependent receptor [Terriglobales bacterium]